MNNGEFVRLDELLTFCSFRQLVPGILSSPGSRCMMCHLANLATWFQSHCPSFMKVSWR